MTLPACSTCGCAAWWHLLPSINRPKRESGCRNDTCPAKPHDYKSDTSLVLAAVAIALDHSTAKPQSKRTTKRKE